jgi:hypothetical protein
MKSKETEMADQEQPTTASAGRSLAGNGKNLTERLRDAGATPDRGRGQAPIMAMEVPPDKEARDMPIAAIVRDWLEGANEHYRRAGLELTASYARKLLEIEDQRHAYMRRMLEGLTKG